MINNKGCKGCLGTGDGDKCLFRRIKEICPCSKCLVKVTCKTRCSKIIMYGIQLKNR